MLRWVVSLVLGVLAVSGTADAAPVRMSLSVSSSTLRYHGGAATASIRLSTGPTAETASVGLVHSTWQDRDMFGSPLRTFDRRIRGAGRITGSFASSCCDIASGASVCQRGGPPDTGSGIDLALAAESTTTVSYRLRLAAPPWAAPVFLTAVVGIPASAPSSAQISFYHLGPHQFAIRGPSGVQIRLAAVAGARRRHNWIYPVVPAGHSVTIAGTTNPRLGHARLRIGYVSSSSARRGAIGTVRTNRHGAFRLHWRPVAKGTYTITAAYRHPAAGLLADHNCDLGLSVS